MSDEYIECPSCNSVVPIGRFCKSCGESLIVAPPAAAPRKAAPSESLEPLIPEEEMPSTLPDFGISVPGMDKLAFSRVMARAELGVIQKDLDLLIKQIQATRQALQLKHADKDLLTARAEQLRAAFEKTKSRREELSGGIGKLALEKVHTAFKEHEEKMPLEYQLPSEATERRVVDYIAGMTDQYALRVAEELSLIKGKCHHEHY